MARPINNIGAGSPIIARVQGNEYLATVGCLVSDSHRVYGLTNRHVTGDAGEVVWSLIENQVERIGTSSSKSSHGCQSLRYTPIFRHTTRSWISISA